MQFIKIVLVFLVIILPCHALAAENIRKITVTGKSETVVEAQYAIIKLNIKYVRKEMNQSHAELMKTISKLSNELKSIGLADKDIKKSLILQGPEYSWENKSQVLKGYYSLSQIDLHVNDISKIGDVYKAMANYENLTISETDYRRNDEFDIRKAEFEKALNLARKKAEYMTQTLNVKVGKVHSIQELSSENYVTRNIYANSVAMRENSTGNSGYGNITVTAVVSVEFELE